MKVVIVMTMKTLMLTMVLEMVTKVTKRRWLGGETGQGDDD